MGRHTSPGCLASFVLSVEGDLYPLSVWWQDFRKCVSAPVQIHHAMKDDIPFVSGKRDQTLKSLLIRFRFVFEHVSDAMWYISALLCSVYAQRYV